jgi:divalent metal cation (Fe/Co/Zn/Cd) transporter
MHFLGNRLLIVGAGTGLLMAGVFLFLPSIADLLGHQNPTRPGWLIALASIPLLLMVDGIHKRIIRTKSSITPAAGSGAFSSSAEPASTA